MKIEIDIHSMTQLRAFATFITTLAEERESDFRQKLAYGNLARDEIGSADIGRSTAMNELAQGTVTGATIAGEQANTNTAPTRKRGEPSPGHKRRTKAEIAEDEAAEKAEAAATQTLTGAIREPSAISTGGERVAPDDEPAVEQQDVADDEPAVEQQDVADEADETAKAGAELSHENLRDSLGKYVQKFGMDAAQLDGPKLFALVFKNPAITKISAVPSDQASLKAALDGINEMLAKNPFDRAPVA